MHNLSMAENLLNAVLSESVKHEGKRVKCIRVVLDDHDYAEAEAMQFCFEALAVGTIAEGANIEIKQLGPKSDGKGNYDPQSVEVKLE